MYLNMLYLTVQRNADSQHIVAVGEGQLNSGIGIHTCTLTHTPDLYQGII